MRTEVLFDNVDASQTNIKEIETEAAQIEQRVEWLLQVTRDGTDADGQLYIEYSIDNDKNLWSPIDNIETLEHFFLLDQDISVQDDRMPANHYRLRYEPNGTTTGTIFADIGIKTYP